MKAFRPPCIREKADQARAKQEAVRRAHLTERQQERRAALAAEQTALDLRIEHERQAMLDLQKSHTDFALAARAEKKPGRIMGFLARITGIKAFRDARQNREDKSRADLHARQLRTLDERHERERRDIRRRERDLAAVETRENQSLEQALKRETFLRAIKRPREITPEFTRAAQPEMERRRGEDTRTLDPGDLSATFGRSASGPGREEREDGGRKPQGPRRQR